MVHAERASEAKTEPVDCFSIVLGARAAGVCVLAGEVLTMEVDVPVPDPMVKVAVGLEGLGVAVVLAAAFFSTC